MLCLITPCKLSALRIGRIAPGFRADLLLLVENPLLNLETLRHPIMVISKGRPLSAEYLHKKLSNHESKFASMTSPILPQKQMDRFVGKYCTQTKLELYLWAEDQLLIGELVGMGKVVLIPNGTNSFFGAAAPVRVTFDQAASIVNKVRVVVSGLPVMSFARVYPDSIPAESSR